ncbi:hypothetical protein ABFW14_03705 [Mycolicibacterium fortuitum]|uniref:hypothetical protein n=1 Tax=Mycolicibacterium TaxID=1866885 RepID=UPI0007ECD0E7|nr:MULTISPECIES: hypothetical protein [Mycolicibacterium]OBK09190.1 hypothetical protein A5637_30405 [Mycolicibacterium fortuitum]
MLIEDGHRILPFGRGLDDGFTAQVLPADVRTEELVLNALVSAHGRVNRLEDGVRNCVEQLSQELIEGKVVFEVEYFYEADTVDDDSPNSAPSLTTDTGATDDQSRTRPVAFQLGWITPGTLGKKWGRQIQYVPAQFGEKQSARGLHFVELDSANLVTVDLSRRTRRALERARTVLAAAADQDATPYKFVRAADAAFDMDRFKAERAKLVLRGTKDVGWGGRGLFDEHMLDPYQIWRHLRFERFKVEVRDAALGGINEMLRCAGARMGFEAKLDLQGLITGDDLDEAEAALRQGSKPLIDLIRIRA